MRKKVLSVLCAAVFACTMLAGCGSSTSTSDAQAEATTEAAVAEAVDDQAAADNVQALIEAIQVQERTDTTDADCVAAKEAWDALTDDQKALVEDADYFGADTGDASLDDPLNGDEIGEKEIIVASFGTSFNDSRVKDIGGVEKALQEAYPDYSVRRAFTAQIIINHIQARDGEVIDNMEQALQRAVDNGVKELIIQPTHLMKGSEYDELSATVEKVEDQIDSITISEPLLGEVGEDETVINDDKKAVAENVVAAAVAEAGADSIDALADDSTALILMGHGTSHEANVTYDQMQTQMNNLGYKNVFIGTVEGEPEDTEVNAVLQKVQDAGYTKVIIRPLMVVAGDHANNDMAGDDDDSWKSIFSAALGEDNVTCQISGMGRVAEIEQIYVAHTGAIINK